MSTTIDQRVVEMQFDNKQFESGVSTTISSIDKLKQSLNFNGASKGLENVGDAARKVDMTPLGSAVETVRTKFSALQIMGVTALSNITNSAVNAGKRIASALTIDPVKTGFSEYETKINAIQTIMSNTASKGTTMEDVTRVIGELNTYADKTIYNFAEMTRNIGTFTAAGIGLEESAAAIQGIANLAAASGSSSQQASTAMYQLSQALSTGTVRLMDWNSVVNAGMGGEKFQEALKATAREHGVAVDDIIKKNGSFRDSLQDGWLSADILNETLQKFTVEGAKEYAQSMVESGKYTQEQADALIKEAQAMEDAATKVKTFTQLWDTLKESAQSGWSQTWEILVGDFEEAKELLTEISEVIGGVIGDSADARNELLENWKILGGREDLIESMRNVFESIGRVVKPISEAFKEIFPPMTAKRLKELTEGLVSFTEKLKMGDDTADKLKRTFKGLFAVVDIVRQIFVAVFKAVGTVLGATNGLTGGVLGVTAAFGDWLVALRDAINEGDVFNKIFQTIAKIVKSIIKVFGKLVGFVNKAFVFPGMELLTNWLTAIGQMMANTGNAAGDMKTSFVNAWNAMCNAFLSSRLFKLLSSVWSILVKIGKAITTVIGNALSEIGDKIANADIEGVFDLIHGLITGGIGIGLIKLIKKIADSFGGMKDSIQDIMDGVADVFKGFQNKLNAEALKEIAIAIGILAASLVVISLINKERLYQALAAIGMLMGMMVVVMKALPAISGSVDLRNMQGSFSGVTTTLVAFATSIAILAGVLAALGSMSIDQITNGMVALTGLFVVLIAAMKVLAHGKSAAKPLRTVVGQMMTVVLAIKALAKVLIELSVLSWDQMAKGLAGVAGLSVVMVGTMALLQTIQKMDIDSGRIISMGLSMVGVAAAMLIMAKTVEIFAGMNWSQIGKAGAALGGLVVAIGAIAAITKLVDMKGMITLGAALIPISVALLILTGSLAIFAHMEWGEIAKAGAALGGLLAFLAILSYVTKWVNMPGMISLSACLIVLSVGLLALTGVLAIYARMAWGEIAKAGAALGGLVVAVAALSAVTNLVNPLKMIAAAGSLLIMAAALLVLVPVIASFSKYDMNTIGSTLVLLGGALLILTLAMHAMKGAIAGAAALALVSGVLLTLLAPALLILSALNIKSVCNALLALAGVLLILGVAGVVLSPVVGVIVALSASVFLLGVGALTLSVALLLLSAGLVSTAGGFAVFSAAFLAFVEMFLQSVIMLGEAIIELALVVITGLKDIIIAICRLIVEAAPAIREAVGALIVAICGAIIDALPIIKELLREVILALCEILVDCVPPIVVAVLEILVGVLAALSEYIPVLVDLLFNLVIGLIDGLAARTPDLIQSVVNLFMSVFKGLADAFGSIDSGVLLEGLAAIGVFAAILAALSIIPALIPGAMGGLLAIALILLELGLILAAFGGLAQIPGVQWIITEGASFIGQLSATFMAIAALTPAVLALSLIGPFVAGAMISVLALGGLMVELTALLAVMGGLAQIPGLDWLIGEGGAFMQKIGTSIGQFVGGLVGGLAQGISSSLPQIGSDLAAFMTNAMPFFTGLSLINEQATNGVKNIATMVLTLTAANLLEGLTSWITGGSSLLTFGAELAAFAPLMVSYAATIATMDAGAVEASANAALALANVANNLPAQGGLFQWFGGERDLGVFGTQLVAFGAGMRSYANSLGTDFPAEAVEASANAAMALSNVANNLPAQGGLFQWFGGERDLGVFGIQLMAFGAGMRGYADALGTDFPAEAVEASANAAQALAGLANNIPKQDGLAQWFGGERDLGVFGDQLIKFGEGMRGYANALGTDFPTEVVTASASAGQALANLANNMPKDKTIWQTIFGGGKTSLDDFGSTLVEFGKAIKKYAKEIEGISIGNLNSATSALKTLVNLAKGIKGVKFDGMGSFANDLEKLGKKGINGFIDAFKDSYDKVEEAGATMIEKAVSGIEDNADDVSDVAEDAADDAADAIGECNDDFYDAGSALVDGLASGISENSYKVEAKAKAMAEAAAKAAKDALKIKSPSRVFYEFGEYSGEGFVGGLSAYESVSYDAGSSMGKSARNGLRDAISRISDAINSDIDAQPTIRPVLDLSDIESGAGTIGSLLGSGSSIGVLANIGAISSAMNRRNQNGANDDVVSAIDKLRKELSSFGGDSYTINGVDFGGDSAVEEAFKTIVRAARMERRM